MFLAVNAFFCSPFSFDLFNLNSKMFEDLQGFLYGLRLCSHVSSLINNLTSFRAFMREF